MITLGSCNCNFGCKFNFFMQRLWKPKLNWDVSIQPKELRQWKKWKEEFPKFYAVSLTLRKRKCKNDQKFKFLLHEILSHWNKYSLRKVLQFIQNEEEIRPIRNILCCVCLRCQASKQELLAHNNR